MSEYWFIVDNGGFQYVFNLGGGFCWSWKPTSNIAYMHATHYPPALSYRHNENGKRNGYSSVTRISFTFILDREALLSLFILPFDYISTLNLWTVKLFYFPNVLVLLKLSTVHFLPYIMHLAYDTRLRFCCSTNVAKFRDFMTTICLVFSFDVHHRWTELPSFVCVVCVIVSVIKWTLLKATAVYVY